MIDRSEMPAEVEEFIQRARSFCTFVESSGDYPLNERLHRAAGLIADLYAAGLRLPLILDDDLFDDRPTRVADSAVGTVPFEAGEFDTYSEVFDPYRLETPVAASLMDDISDIYSDVRAGGLLLDSGCTWRVAVWHWRFHLEIHWGDHAVDALRALQRAIVRSK